jgi:arylformamidase
MPRRIILLKGEQTLKKIIDLTLDLTEGMPVFPVPWYPKPKFEAVLTPAQCPAGRTASKALVFMHAGTHVDAPKHFFYERGTIEQVPLDVLCGPTTVIDMYGKGNLEPITAADLEGACPKPIKKGNRAIIRTGYTDRCWGNDDYFQVSPYLTPDAAGWLVDQGSSSWPSTSRPTSPATPHSRFTKSSWATA